MIHFRTLLYIPDSDNAHHSSHPTFPLIAIEIWVGVVGLGPFRVDPSICPLSFSTMMAPNSWASTCSKSIRVDSSRSALYSIAAARKTAADTIIVRLMLICWHQRTQNSKAVSPHQALRYLMTIRRMEAKDKIRERTCDWGAICIVDRSGVRHFPSLLSLLFLCWFWCWFWFLSCFFLQCVF